MGLRRAALLATTIVGSAPALMGIVSLSLCPMTAEAQDYTTAALTGTVTDAAAKPVAGASVSIRSPQGGTRTAQTATDGTFSIPSLAFGAYTATVTGTGFAPTTSQVTVSPNGSNYSFLLTSGVSEVVVTGKVRRREDFTKTDTGLVVDVPDLSSRVPLGRSVTNIVRLAPSVSIPDATINASARRNQTLSSVAGGSAAETVYYVNGLNVTDQRTFLGFADLPFDAIQTVDVKTGGYQAEFGRATGGVINVVTKSGSNEYHAGGSIFYTPSSLSETSPNSYGAAGSGTFGSRTYNDTARSSLIDSDVYLSGPLIKDHVFFFGILNPRNQFATSAGSIPIQTPAAGAAADLNPTTGGTITKSHTDSPRWLGKVDINITDKQKIEATLFSDAQKTVFNTFAYDRAGLGALSSSTTEKAGGLNQIYKYTGVFTDWFTLSGQYGQVRSQYSDSSPQAGISRARDLTVAGTTTYLTGVRSFITIDSAAQDVRESERVDGDFYFRILGRHHVRLGYDREALRSSDLTAPTGGAGYDFYIAPASGVLQGSGGATIGQPGQLFARQLVFQSGGLFKADQDAYYIEDSWQPFSRLTIQAGVRNDTYNYKTSSGQSFIKLKDQYAPRLGFTYDAFGTGEDKIYGSFGRYYLPIAENTAIREAGANPYFYRYFNTPSVSVDANGHPVLGTIIGPDTVFGSSIPPDYRTVASSNIEPQYKDEFIVGYEHQFRNFQLFNSDALKNLRVGLRYVDLTLKETIEDTDLGYAVSNYCASTPGACADGVSDSYQGVYTLLNPGRDARVFLDLTNGAGGAAGKYVTLSKAQLGLPSATNHYQALEFTFDRPFDGKWALQGSYVLAKSHGNYEGGVNSDIGQTDTSITQDFDNRFFEIGQKGDLPNSHTHTIKLFGTYSPIEDLTLGLNFTAQSGRKFSCLGYDPDDDTLSPSPSQRFCPLGPGGAIVQTPRGTLVTTPWTTNVDFQLVYKLPLPGPYGAPVIEVDVFNIFNTQEITRIVEQGPISGDLTTLSPTYNLPRSYQTPRSVRFGLRYAF